MNAFFKSFVYAFKGIKLSLLERNTRIHFFCALLVISAGFFFSISATEWSILLLCMGIVISLEIINTALEQLVNLVSPHYHELAGKVKDLAAGAVLLFSIISAIIGVLIFWKYLVLIF